MRQQVQWYLAEGLATARALPGPDSPQRRQGAIASFSARLDALRYVDEISDEERADWHNRLLIAVGIEPPPPAEPGVVRAFFVGPGPPPVPPPVTVPTFVRSRLGPDREWEYHGGRFRVMAVDLFDTMVCIRWRLAGQLDLLSLFPSESAQLARDLEGVDDWAKDELRKKAERHLRGRRLFAFALKDDLGTEYLNRGGSSGGGSGGISGEAEFLPAPPPQATRLELSWFELSIDIPLLDGPQPD